LNSHSGPSVVMADGHPKQKLDGDQLARRRVRACGLQVRRGAGARGVFNRNTVTTRMDIGLCGGRIRNMFRNTTVTRSLQTAIIVLADGHKGVAIAEVMLLVLGKKVDTMWGRAWTWRLRAL
jgi:hypothetical protein